LSSTASGARGRWGEDRAAAHYRSLGFEILDRNWRHGRRDVPGELDLVVWRPGLVVFCEVKTRGRSRYGGAAVSVDASKQARTRALAESWSRANPHHDDVRFDVIAIEGVRLVHLEAAF
jgi:putative endonuclease